MQESKNTPTQIRIDAFLASVLNISREMVSKMIKSNCITLNQQTVSKPSLKVNTDYTILQRQPTEPDQSTANCICYYSLEIQPSKIEPVNIPLNIVYEDNDLIVINKQSGLLTHPGSSNYHNTLVNALLYYSAEQKSKGIHTTLSSIGGVERPGIVHRLDKDTSGLIIVAKTDHAHQSLSEQIANRTAKRTYICLCYSSPKNPIGTIETYLDRHPKDYERFIAIPMPLPYKQNNHSSNQLLPPQGRYSRTKYKVLQNFCNTHFSLIECELDTGRTHQIRIHMEYIKTPIVGDQTYGFRSHTQIKAMLLKNCNLTQQNSQAAYNLISSLGGQLLQSYKLQFIHPTKNTQMNFELPLKKEIADIINLLK